MAEAMAPAPGWHRVLLLAATVLGVALTGSLGRWQLDRAAQKEALQAAIDSRGGLAPLRLEAMSPQQAADPALHHRSAVVRGRWLERHTVFLDNRQMNGRPGFYAVTPLQLAGRRDAVLVQRGWAPRDPLDRTRVPALPQAGGEVELRGRIAPPPSKLFEFARSGSGAIRQNLETDAFAQEIGVPLWPLTFVQEQDAAAGGAGDGLLRQWPRPAVDVHKHYGYAFQWFGLGALMAGLYVWFQLIRPRLRR
ncbi:SURF1 family protein [Caldimonas tepidiphila]|uniref:SURF1 family protein n=1 Tax=Caldimonas tepidiphila TaxID=2315841 RepID=UPI001F0CB108|nr:SURF1 family protein [Caldimonas tepidiphila]